MYIWEGAVYLAGVERNGKRVGTVRWRFMCWPEYGATPRVTTSLLDGARRVLRTPTA